jgi:hypothetical protein
VSAQTWQETLVWAAGDGTALSNSLTRTSIIPVQAKWTAPANYFAYVGKTMRVSAKGRISNVVTTPGTLTLDVGIGATNLFTSTFSLNAVAKTNVTWLFEAEMVLRAIGSSSNFMAIGQFTSESVTGAAFGIANTMAMPAATPAVGGNFDSTTANVWDLFATFSVQNSGNALTLHTYKIEALN